MVWMMTSAGSLRQRYFVRSPHRSGMAPQTVSHDPAAPLEVTLVLQTMISVGSPSTLINSKGLLNCVEHPQPPLVILSICLSVCIFAFLPRRIKRARFHHSQVKKTLLIFSEIKVNDYSFVGDNLLSLPLCLSISYCFLSTHWQNN